MTLSTRLARTREILSGLSGNGKPLYAGMSAGTVLSLAHGDGTRRPHPSVLTAAVRACSSECSWSFDNYHFMPPYSELAEAIRSDMSSSSPSFAQVASICIDSGTARLFSSYLTVCSRPGDYLLIPRPFYHGLVDWCTATRVQPRVVYSRRSNDYKVDVTDLDRCLAKLPTYSGLAGLLLSNPTFTGAIYDSDELAAIHEWTRARRTTLLIDTVFRRTEFDGRLTAITGNAGDSLDSLLVFGGVSKAYNLANLRVGWVAGDPKLVTLMETYREQTMGAVPFMAQAMAAAALRAPLSYLVDNAKECELRATLVTDKLRAINNELGDSIVTVEHSPRAGHGMLLSANHLAQTFSPDGEKIITSLDLCKYLLRYQGVAISPAYSQGFDGMQFRVAFGSVGLSATYVSSRPAEHEAILAGARLATEGENNGSAQMCHQQADFTAGRIIIDAAFDRIYRGLYQLLCSR